VDLGAFFSLADLYLAYRKAKAEAFYENSHFSALSFAYYERELQKNLLRLLGLLRRSDGPWSAKPSFVGGYVYAPKSVSDFPDNTSSGPQFRAINPADAWRHAFLNADERRTDAEFRLLITPTVEFAVIAALWILKVGHIFDGRLSDSHVYANRIRRNRNYVTLERPWLSEPNRDCLGIFPPYFSAYRKWRENGLEAMQRVLTQGSHIFAITMDLQRFYHNVAPGFLLDTRFHEQLDLALSDEEREFTKNFVAALDVWYEKTPDHKSRPQGAIPVGLSASKVISNVLLREFDTAVVKYLKPIYYGRYVDDVFLVIRRPTDTSSGDEFLRYLAGQLSGFLKYESSRGGDASIRLMLPYAEESELVFTGSKQKIFDLSGNHGLDLVSHIGEQIRIQSSEHRLLPELPNSDVAMAARALLATPDATLEADALRKADVVSVRRLGFALLLRDVEAYSHDLQPAVWRSLRLRFYSLVDRHLLTAHGFFDYAGYLHRVFSLMVACGDFDHVALFLDRFKNVIDLLRETTTAGTTARGKFERCLTYYATSFVDAALRASTVDRFSKWRELGRSLRRLEQIAQVSPIRTTSAALQNLSRQLLLSDWGRRSYKDFWIYSQTDDASGPRVPLQVSVQRVIRLGGIREFRRFAELRVPFWPALAFPTRPLSVAEIGLISPRVMEEPDRFREAILALRGARVRTRDIIGFAPAHGSSQPAEFMIPNRPSAALRVAVTSVETTLDQWKKAAKRRPDHSLKRYHLLLNLINRILKDRPRARYVVFPECSVPRRWAFNVAAKLAQNRVSFLAGLEYYFDRKRRKLRNDCFLSLTTTWPGYATNIVRLQPKLVPAHNERREIRKVSKSPLYEPTGVDRVLPVYVHGKLFFGILLCSDLTNITNRRYFQGAVDALFVLEWNPDIGTFSFLIEATAHDIHAFVVQINNRMYGDSRIRGPYREEHKRDLVRVKGGTSDYYVLSAVDFFQLRQFHRHGPKGGDAAFKPLPIGFKISRSRKNG
jgi:hypothetical protein